MTKKYSQRNLLLFISVLFICALPANAQVYEVSYKQLPSKLLDGNEPIKICILELVGAKHKLYDGLIDDNVIKNKYLIYPTDVLIENKASLGNDLDPDNKDFLKSLNEILGVEYLLHWVNLSDSGDTYNLTIYSTKNFQKIYSKELFSSVNSTPIQDIKKLLIENTEPIYNVASGELQVNSKPANANFKLYKDTLLVKEWSGNEKQKIKAGKYSLISFADGFQKNIKSIEVAADKATVVSVEMEQDLSMLPSIYTTNNMISRIRQQMKGDQIKIIYDLQSGTNDSYNIDLTLIDKNSKNSVNLKNVTGDLKDVTPGENKTIIWSFKNETGINSGLQNYEIDISAVKSGGISWYMYAGGGALLLGGAAALLLKGSSAASPAQTTRTKIGTPPPRPAGN